MALIVVSHLTPMTEAKPGLKTSVHRPGAGGKSESGPEHITARKGLEDSHEADPGGVENRPGKVMGHSPGAVCW